MVQALERSFSSLSSVAAAEQREAAFGCEAVASPADAVCLMYRNLRFYDCFAAERSLASSTAATAERRLRQLLQRLWRSGNQHLHLPRHHDFDHSGPVAHQGAVGIDGRHAAQQ
ncbi:hypothetical protein FFH90_017690 [Pseudomonas sp. ATCC 43928]|nr:hypothetical protein FFH90_017690 [Pseudomonas sp. ATCC 43928]